MIASYIRRVPSSFRSAGCAPQVKCATKAGAGASAKPPNLGGIEEWVVPARREGSEELVMNGVAAAAVRGRHVELAQNIADVAVDRSLAQAQLTRQSLCWYDRSKSGAAPGARAPSRDVPGVGWPGMFGASRRASSGCAPSRSNSDRAALCSSLAASSSPRARQASPMSTRTRAASYGASRRCHCSNAHRRGSSAASRMAFGKGDRAVCLRDHRAKAVGVEHVGQCL